MPPQVLAIVVLPSETKLLNSDVAGRPAGRYLLDRLGGCENVVLRVAAADGTLPAWCDVSRISAGPTDEDTGNPLHRHILIVDGRAWLSHAVLAHVLLKARESGTGFRVTGSSGAPSLGERQTTTLAVHLSPGQGRDVLRTLRTWFQRIEQLLEADAVASTCTVDAAPLDAAEPALLIDSYAVLATVEQQVLFQRATAALSRGVRLRDPLQVYLRGDLECGADVELDVGVIIEGTVVLGERVRIGAHSIVRDSHIGDDTCIHPFSIVEHSSIGKGGFVGPYGRIRPGNVIGDGVQIGNFVEVKGSQIGDGSRINHHSFIGDAVLADRVTIGAGTITCNHDGIRTNQTVIESGAYIGSGCNLVAPLRIGGRATVGAGSTITRDVPAAKLTLARTLQTTIENWRGPKKR